MAARVEGGGGKKNILGLNIGNPSALVAPCVLFFVLWRSRPAPAAFCFPCLGERGAPKMWTLFFSYRTWRPRPFTHALNTTYACPGVCCMWEQKEEQRLETARRLAAHIPTQHGPFIHARVGHEGEGEKEERRKERAEPPIACLERNSPSARVPAFFRLLCVG